MNLRSLIAHAAALTLALSAGIATAGGNHAGGHHDSD